MTKNRKPAHLIELSAAVAPVRERHRELIDAACAWQQGRDRRTDPDHFALVCAAAEQAGGDVSPVRWLRHEVSGVIRCSLPTWCSLQSCLWPEDVVETVWEWFDFLHATGRLQPGSDPVAELRKPLACCGWLDADGHRLPTDAERAIPCECFLPYRETAELLGELVRHGERTGVDPLDELRELVGRPRQQPAGWPWWSEEDGPYESM